MIPHLAAVAQLERLEQLEPHQPQQHQQAHHHHQQQQHHHQQHQQQQPQLAANNQTLDESQADGAGQCGRFETSAGAYEDEFHVSLSTFWYCFLAFITTLGLLVSLVSNMIIIYLFSKTPSLRRNPSNIIAVNLSLSDLLYCTQWPSVIYCSLTQSTWMLEIDFLCQTFGFLTVSTALASILTVLAMSVERAVVIGYSIHAKSRFTIRGAWLIVVLIWILSIVSCLPPLFGRFNRYTLDPSKTSCTLDYLSSKTNHKLYILVLYVAYWIAPAIVITICYVAIIVTFKRSSRSLKSIDRPTEAAAAARSLPSPTARSFASLGAADEPMTPRQAISSAGDDHHGGVGTGASWHGCCGAWRRRRQWRQWRPWRPWRQRRQRARTSERGRRFCFKMARRGNLRHPIGSAAPLRGLQQRAGRATQRPPPRAGSVEAADLQAMPPPSPSPPPQSSLPNQLASRQAGGGRRDCEQLHCEAPTGLAGEKVNPIQANAKIELAAGAPRVEVARAQIGAGRNGGGDDGGPRAPRQQRPPLKRQDVTSARPGHLMAARAADTNEAAAQLDGRAGELPDAAGEPGEFEVEVETELGASGKRECCERPPAGDDEQRSSPAVRGRRRGELARSRTLLELAPGRQLHAPPPTTRAGPGGLARAATMNLASASRLRFESQQLASAASGKLAAAARPHQRSAAASAAASACFGPAGQSNNRRQPQPQPPPPHRLQLASSSCHIGASGAQLSRTGLQIRLAKMAFYLILLWFVSWTPIASLAMLNSVVKCNHRASALAVFLANTMTKLGPAFDVFIYGISHPKIKSKFKEIIKWLLMIGRHKPAGPGQTRAGLSARHAFEHSKRISMRSNVSQPAMAR